MDNSELESRSESVDRAVQLLDQLLETADGGQRIVLGQYEASTIIGLLTDKLYRAEVMSLLGFDTQSTSSQTE